MEKQNYKIKSKSDELMLDVLTIVPDGEVKGILQISYGMTEYKEKYIPFMEFISKNGYLTVIHDHRGHGASIKSKEDFGYFYEENAEFIVEDLHQITIDIKKKYPDKPIYLIGHSMGSMVVRKYIKKYDADIDKLMVCGSPSNNSLSSFGIKLLKILKAIKGERYRSDYIQSVALGMSLKEYKVRQVEKNLMKEKDMLENKYAKPDLTGYTFTINGFINLLTLVKDIYNNDGWSVNNPELPIFFISGKDDSVMGNEEKWYQSQEFLKSVGYKNISYQLYPGMKHEILNEREDKVVWNEVLEWIDK